MQNPTTRLDELIEILDLALIRAGSMRRLAKYLGCNYQSIVQWYAGNTTPNRCSVAKIRFFARHGIPIKEVKSNDHSARRISYSSIAYETPVCDLQAGVSRET